MSDPINVIVTPQGPAVTASVSSVGASITSVVQSGGIGPVGPIGPTGPAGSDANVTSANVISALGYTPVNPSSLGSAAYSESSSFDLVGSANTALATATTRAIAFSIAL
jgi:hypothetical protein